MKIPLRNRAGLISTKAWPIIAPNEILHVLTDNGLVGKYMVGGCSLEQFWDRMLQEPGFIKLAQVFAQADKSKLLAVKLHGDDRKFFNLENIMVFVAILG